MGAFYSQLSYSIGNEDWETEQKALQITPKDRILCVTASGDRPLNLLFSDCKEIITVDANPSQTALFDLKKTALGLLSHEEYLAFLGVSHHPDRLELFKKIEPHLDPISVVYWKKNKPKLKQGILYQGALEKWTKIISSSIALFRKKKIEQLFACSTLEEQQTFVEKHWHRPAWKKTFDVILNPFITRYLIRDPGLYFHIDPSIKVGDYLYNKIHCALKKFPVKECIIISLFLKGTVYKEGFSPYLTQQGSEVIRSNLSKISFTTSDLISYLEKSPESSFDCFSFSDVASYISPEDFNRLTKAMVRAARPGARFCIRQLMSRHSFPKEIASIIVRDEELERGLEDQDRCFLYHFTVGKILKNG